MTAYRPDPTMRVLIGGTAPDAELENGVLDIARKLGATRVEVKSDEMFIAVALAYQDTDWEFSVVLQHPSLGSPWRKRILGFVNSLNI